MIRRPCRSLSSDAFSPSVRIIIKKWRSDAFLWTEPRIILSSHRVAGRTRFVTSYNLFRTMSRHFSQYPPELNASCMRQQERARGRLGALHAGPQGCWETCGDDERQGNAWSAVPTRQARIKACAHRPNLEAKVSKEIGRVARICVCPTRTSRKQRLVLSHFI